MGKHLVSVLTTVNAPYCNQLDGAERAHCFSDVALAKYSSGQVSSFLGEVPVAQQISFAADFGIELEALKVFASDWQRLSAIACDLTTPEIIAKKVHHRDSDAKPRDIFDIAVAARTRRDEVVMRCGTFTTMVQTTLARMEKAQSRFRRPQDQSAFDLT